MKGNLSLLLSVIDSFIEHSNSSISREELAKALIGHVPQIDVPVAKITSVLSKRLAPKEKRELSIALRQALFQQICPEHTADIVHDFCQLVFGKSVRDDVPRILYIWEARSLDTFEVVFSALKEWAARGENFFKKTKWTVTGWDEALKKSLHASILEAKSNEELREKLRREKEEAVRSLKQTEEELELMRLSRELEEEMGNANC